MNTIPVYELMPQHNGQQIFNRKAQVIVYDDWVYLKSYSVDVARVSNIMGKRKAEVFGTHSQTTLKHIKEFLIQHGYKAENKKQIINDYIK